jgi:hypothetical protein
MNKNNGAPHFPSTPIEMEYKIAFLTARVSVLTELLAKFLAAQNYTISGGVPPFDWIRQTTEAELRQYLKAMSDHYPDEAKQLSEMMDSMPQKPKKENE